MRKSVLKLFIIDDNMQSQTIKLLKTRKSKNTSQNITKTSHINKHNNKQQEYTNNYKLKATIQRTIQ